MAAVVPYSPYRWIVLPDRQYEPESYFPTAPTQTQACFGHWRSRSHTSTPYVPSCRPHQEVRVQGPRPILGCIHAKSSAVNLIKLTRSRPSVSMHYSVLHLRINKVRSNRARIAKSMVIMSLMVITTVCLHTG